MINFMDIEKQLATIKEENAQSRQQLKKLVALRNELSLNRWRLDNSERQDKIFKSNLTLLSSILNPTNLVKLTSNNDHIKKINESLKKQIQELRKEKEEVK